MDVTSRACLVYILGFTQMQLLKMETSRPCWSIKVVQIFTAVNGPTAEGNCRRYVHMELALYPCLNSIIPLRLTCRSYLWTHRRERLPGFSSGQLEPPSCALKVNNQRTHGRRPVTVEGNCSRNGNGVMATRRIITRQECLVREREPIRTGGRNNDVPMRGRTVKDVVNDMPTDSKLICWD